MAKTAHGRFSVRWCDEVCLVELQGSFNREGVAALDRAIRAAWLEAGSPARWAHVMDLRKWEGGTPDSFQLARALAFWTVTHGAVAILRIQLANFLSRITDRQGVLEDTEVPVINCASPDEAWQWLESRALRCAACRTLTA